MVEPLHTLSTPCLSDGTLNLKKEEVRLTTAFAVLSSAAIAQTSASPPATKPAPAASATDSSKSSIPTQVEKWTKDQWEAAKKEWAKDTAKWADCQRGSRANRNLKTARAGHSSTMYDWLRLDGLRNGVLGPEREARQSSQSVCTPHRIMMVSGCLPLAKPCKDRLRRGNAIE